MSYELHQLKTQNSKLKTPEVVAGAALLGYLLVFYIFFNHHQDLRGFIWIGKNYVEKSHVSPEIRLDPDFQYQTGGYDGQFAYFIALDPANARKIARFLEEHPRVECVRYPGLASHPQHDLAGRQMRSFGGMISFQVKGGFEEARQIAQSTRLFLLAESLGGVESLIEHPGLMTHLSVANSPLQVPDNLVRLSVGIEDSDDLIRDLATAMNSES